MRRVSLAAFVFAVTFTAAACSSGKNSASPSTTETVPTSTLPTVPTRFRIERQDLIAARALWAQTRPTAYEVTTNAGGGLQGFVECRWRVSGSDVVLIEGLNTQRCEGQEIRTPEDAFASIEAAFSSPLRREVHVSYDRQGVPISASFIAPDAMDLNSGWTMTVQPA